jgi:hypothetical protein
VQVVSFVVEGSIEEGMSGLLDGGEQEVFFGGSRLKRFMESVENVTGGIPAPIVEKAPDPAAPELAAEDSIEGNSEVAVAAASPRAAADPLSNLLRTGLDLLTQFAAAGRAGSGRSDAVANCSSESEMSARARAT